MKTSRAQRARVGGTESAYAVVAYPRPFTTSQAAQCRRRHL